MRTWFNLFFFARVKNVRSSLWGYEVIDNAHVPTGLTPPRHARNRFTPQHQGKRVLGSVERRVGRLAKRGYKLPVCVELTCYHSGWNILETAPLLDGTFDCEEQPKKDEPKK